MHPFFKIINANFSLTQIGMLNWWADEMFKELDKYVASGLECDEEFGTKVPFDQEKEWDFPDPPEICQ